tara:strand:+ start:495 stop:893 length:399 start_codon:yes stop_codon:yes gene_type:complete
VTPDQKTKFDSWVKENYGTYELAYGSCHRAASEMVDAFPELELVRGHVICPEPWGKRGHWWCTLGEDIVDPTAHQFTAGILEYDPYEEGDEVYLGVCMNCGGKQWGTSQTDYNSWCSDECQQELTAYFSRID